jgi:hypothetical protein
MIARMIHSIFDKIRDGGPIDFTDQSLSQQLQADGIALLENGFVPPVLPIDVVLIQRKLAGIFMLGARLRACVDIGALLRAHQRFTP